MLLVFLIAVFERSVYLLVSDFPICNVFYYENSRCSINSEEKKKTRVKGNTAHTTGSYCHYRITAVVY